MNRHRPESAVFIALVTLSLCFAACTDPKKNQGAKKKDPAPKPAEVAEKPEPSEKDEVGEPSQEDVARARALRIKTLQGSLKIAMVEEDLEKALSIVKELEQVDPKNPEYVDKKAAIATAIVKRKQRKSAGALIEKAKKETDLKKALALCEQALSANPQLAKAYEVLGMIHLKLAEKSARVGERADRLKSLMRAKGQFEKCIKIDGANQQAYFSLAEIQKQVMASIPEYKKNYRRAFMCDKNSVLGKLANARVLELEGRPERVLGAYDAVLRKDPKNRAALLSRAELKRRARNYDEALIDLDKILGEDKNEPYALTLKAHISSNQGDFEGALRVVERALSIHKGSAMAYGVRALARLFKGDRVGARNDCEKALRLDRTCYLPYRVRGELRLSAKEVDSIGAEGDLRTAVRFGPMIADNFYGYGMLLQRHDDKEGALRAYNKCLALDSNHWKALSHRATVYRLLHAYDQAERDASKALKLNPKNGALWLQRSKLRWVRLRKGGISYAAKEWNEVLADLTKSLEIQPNLADSYGRRAFVYRRRKDFQKALSDYNKAIALKPTDVYVWYGYRGLLYAEHSKHKEAVADLGEYLKSASSTHQIYSRVQKERARCRRELERQ